MNNLIKRAIRRWLASGLITAPSPSTGGLTLDGTSLLTLDGSVTLPLA